MPPEKCPQALSVQTTESLLSMIYKLRFQRDLQFLVSINVKIKNLYLNLVRISIKKIAVSWQSEFRASIFQSDVFYLNLNTRHHV